MESILPTEEYKEVEGQVYVNPDTALNESNQFIDNLRSIQDQQNQETAQQTYNLGTDIQSVQGGLGTNTPAGLNYFTSRYQVPQTASAISDLRAAAQATALNEVLADQQAIMKQRYEDAYKAYQKRARERAARAARASRYGSGGSGGSGGSSGSSGSSGNASTWGGETKKVPTTPGTYTAENYISLDENDVKRGGTYMQPLGYDHPIRVLPSGGKWIANRAAEFRNILQNVRNK